MITKTVDYQAGNINAKGYLAYHESKEKKPLVMVVHAFEGLNDLAKNYAEKIADLGYIGFAVDMYGGGVVEHDLEGCMTQAKKLFNDRTLVRGRMLDALKFSRTLAYVDSTKIASIGFCLGGMCSLDLARAGADVRGVASFHGSLTSPEGLGRYPVDAKVLVMTGYEDPQIPVESVNAFMDDMSDADVQLISYNQAKHAFTDPEAHKIGGPEMGREYSAKTTERSWKACVDFFEEIFA